MREELEAKMFCQLLYKEGYVEGTSGNLSFRDRSRVKRTRTGCTLDDPFFVDTESFEASSDVNLHKEIYRLTDSDWIFHVHKDLKLKFLLTDKDLDLHWFNVRDHGVWVGCGVDIKIYRILEDEGIL